MAGRGLVGLARLVKVRRGQSRRGRHGRLTVRGLARRGRRGTAWWGKARPGLAGPGSQGSVRPGEPRQVGAGMASRGMSG